MDPRSPATPETLPQQLQLGQQIFAETLEARRALAEISSVQKQLADLEQKLGEQNSALKSALAKAQLEIGNIVSNKASKRRAAREDYKTATPNMASALRVVESGDRAVPSQAIARLQGVRQPIKTGIAEWTKFKQTNCPS